MEKLDSNEARSGFYPKNAIAGYGGSSSGMSPTPPWKITKKKNFKKKSGNASKRIENASRKK